MSAMAQPHEMQDEMVARSILNLRSGLSEYVSVQAPLRSAPIFLQSGRRSRKFQSVVVLLEHNREGLDFGQYEEVSPSKLIALALSLLLQACRPILERAKGCPQ